MKLIWGVLAAIVATLTGTAVLGDLVSGEIRGRLDRLPHALIRLAAHRLPSDVRQDLAEEWTAELHEILRGAEALPVTRLYRGTRYGLGLLWAAPSIGRDISGITIQDVWDELEAIGFRVIDAGGGHRLLEDRYRRRIELPSRGHAEDHAASLELLAQVRAWGLRPVASGKYQALVYLSGRRHQGF